MTHRISDSRPWLKHYDEGVPHQIYYPTVSVPHLLEDAAHCSPEAACLIFADHTLTYAQVDRLVNRLAAALAERGVKQGDRIGLLLPNLPAFVLAYFAILKLGGIVVAINPLYTAREIHHRLVDAGIEILFALRGLCPAVQDARVGTALRTVIVVEIDDPFSQAPGYTPLSPVPFLLCGLNDFLLNHRKLRE